MDAVLQIAGGDCLRVLLTEPSSSSSLRFLEPDPLIAGSELRGPSSLLHGASQVQVLPLRRPKCDRFHAIVRDTRKNFMPAEPAPDPLLSTNTKKAARASSDWELEVTTQCIYLQVGQSCFTQLKSAHDAKEHRDRRSKATWRQLQQDRPELQILRGKPRPPRFLDVLTVQWCKPKKDQNREVHALNGNTLSLHLALVPASFLVLLRFREMRPASKPRERANCALAIVL